MNMLIKQARIVDSAQDFIGDVYIEDGKIKEIGIDLNKQCETIDAKGYTLMPAFVDLHCHFRDPGLTYKEDIETGSKAAVRGGYTLVNLMGNTKPICNTMETVNYVKEKAAKVGLIEVNQVVSITEDLKGKSIEHLDNIDKSVKFLSDDGKGVLNNKIMIDAMVKAKEKGLGIMSHTEDEEIVEKSARLSENMMTWRDVALSKFTGCKLHMCHVSTKEAMQYVIDGKKENVKVTCEVTPHHLALNSDTDYRVNPPLREEEDRKFLIRALQEGYVDAIGTDHAPHSKEDKEKGACGISGLETAFPVCYTALVKEGYITLNELSKVMSKNPAEILNVNKGMIQIGYDGDFVLVDTEKEIEVDSKKFFSKGKNTPLDGKKYFGDVIMTIRGGKVVYKNV